MVEGDDGSLQPRTGRWMLKLAHGEAEPVAAAVSDSTAERAGQDTLLGQCKLKANLANWVQHLSRFESNTTIKQSYRYFDGRVDKNEYQINITGQVAREVRLGPAPRHQDV